MYHTAFGTCCEAPAGTSSTGSPWGIDVTMSWEIYQWATIPSDHELQSIRPWADNSTKKLHLAYVQGIHNQSVTGLELVEAQYVEQVSCVVIQNPFSSAKHLFRVGFTFCSYGGLIFITQWNIWNLTFWYCDHLFLCPASVHQRKTVLNNELNATQGKFTDKSSKKVYWAIK